MLTLCGRRPRGPRHEFLVTGLEGKQMVSCIRSGWTISGLSSVWRAVQTAPTGSKEPSGRWSWGRDPSRSGEADEMPAGRHGRVAK